jgi:two-component system chemotaxis response regulator CheY
VTTILVVDDMAVFREPIAASLRLAGYETLCAADGEDALRVARARRPDLILLDVSMPKMDGLTFLKHLRADPEVAGTRVILLTALSEKKHVLSAGALGVRDYLLKSRFRLQTCSSGQEDRGRRDRRAGTGTGARGPAAGSGRAGRAGSGCADAAPAPVVTVTAAAAPRSRRRPRQGLRQRPRRRSRGC